VIPGIPVPFLLFGATLLGVAVYHRRSFEVAVTGLCVIAVHALLTTDLDLVAHLAHEARLVANLIGLLLGFAILAKQFEDSRVPDWLPRWLPDDWWGGFVLLVLVGVLSTFLDNIAAAMIGGVMAGKLYQGRVRVGFLAAIVAASNAGGAGSVIGDTTTTMMWIAGVPAIHVADAFVGAAAAILVSGMIAARAQQRVQPIQKDPAGRPVIDAGRLAVVALMIAGTIAANVALDFPAAGLWAAIVISSAVRATPWTETARAIKGSLFLCSLVLSASLMPVSSLPDPTWQTALGLGFVSAVFDNIPLTALALYQGGYDWGLLAFAVGYGGSMIWFGSSAGVALCNLFPEARNTGRWLAEGWHVAVAYVIGFFATLLVFGWHPDILPP
jgi:Na+/H+ antiporter NhaD/arsenite permease-like protein